MVARWQRALALGIMLCRHHALRASQDAMLSCLCHYNQMLACRMGVAVHSHGRSLVGVSCSHGPHPHVFSQEALSEMLGCTAACFATFVKHKYLLLVTYADTLLLVLLLLAFSCFHCFSSRQHRSSNGSSGICGGFQGCCFIVSCAEAFWGH
jgi:hypothetical protein